MSGASGLVTIIQLCIWPRLTGTPSLDTFRLVQLGPHCTGPLPRHVQSNLDLTVHPLSPTPICSIELVRLGLHCTGPPQTCLNFFTLDLTVQGTHLYSPPPPHLSRHEAHTVGKRAVGILLECFLVIIMVKQPVVCRMVAGRGEGWGCGGREWGRFWPGVIEPVSDPSGVHRACMISFNNRHTIPERWTCTRMHVHSPANTPGLLTFTHLVLEKVFSLWIYDFSFCTSFWLFRFFRFSKKIKLR